MYCVVILWQPAPWILNGYRILLIFGFFKSPCQVWPCKVKIIIMSLEKIYISEYLWVLSELKINQVFHNWDMSQSPDSGVLQLQNSNILVFGYFCKKASKYLQQFKSYTGANLAVAIWIKTDIYSNKLHVLSIFWCNLALFACIEQVKIIYLQRHRWSFHCNIFFLFSACQSQNTCHSMADLLQFWL